MEISISIETEDGFLLDFETNELSFKNQRIQLKTDLFANSSINQYYFRKRTT